MPYFDGAQPYFTWNLALKYFGLCSPRTLGAFYLENNLFAYSAANASYQRCLWISDDNDQAKESPVAGYPAKGKVGGNVMYNTVRVYGCMRPAERLGDKSWYPSAYSEITATEENPFSTSDATNGIFTQASGFTSYGAKR